MTSGTATESMMVQSMTIEARLDQLEAAINEALGYTVALRRWDESEEKTPQTEGGLATLQRCQDRATELNERLRSIVEITGRID